jgi:hypothetical protein
MNAVAQKATPQRANRMTLAAVTKGKVDAPYRIVVTGVDGVGKSVFAAAAPKPIFLCAEDGTHHLDVARFPEPRTWQDARDAIATLTADSGGFETLVIDTVDWLEPLLWDHVCEQDGKDSIEKVGGGFGKGYVAAVDGWRHLLADIDKLQREQKMNVILLGHAFIKKFSNPEGADYDRWILKLHEKSASLIREWAKGVYFANYETFAVKEKEKVKGVSSGARKLYTQRTAAYDAKDRYGLPESLPLSYAEFDKLAQAGKASQIEEIQKRIADLSARADDTLKKQIEAAVQRANGDADKLAQLADWASTKVKE